MYRFIGKGRLFNVKERFVISKRVISCVLTCVLITSTVLGDKVLVNANELEIASKVDTIVDLESDTANTVDDSSMAGNVQAATGSAITVNNLTVEGLSGEEVIVPKDSAAIFWVRSKIVENEKQATIGEFQKYHNISTSIPVYELKGQKDINNTLGEFDIQDKSGKSISTYAYSNEDVASGKRYTEIIV